MIIMRGFRKPTKSEIIQDQKEVIDMLVDIVNEQGKIINERQNS